MTVGEAIKTTLKTQKKTIQWLSNETGIPVGTLYNLTKKSGALSTDTTNIEKIANALGNDFISLLHNDDGYAMLVDRFKKILDTYHNGQYPISDCNMKTLNDIVSYNLDSLSNIISRTLPAFLLFDEYVPTVEEFLDGNDDSNE